MFLRQRGGERLDVLDAHQRHLALMRQPAKAQEFAEQAPKVPVVRLRKVDNLILRHPAAVDAAKVVEDHLPPKRQEPVNKFPRRRHIDDVILRHRHGGRADAVVRQRQRNVPDAVASEQRSRGRSAPQQRRAIIVARDREVVGLDLPERRLARKELEAGLLGRKARGETCRAAGAVTAVGQFLRREEPAEIGRRRLREQALDSGDLDGIDPAAAVGAERDAYRGGSRSARTLHGHGLGSGRLLRGHEPAARRRCRRSRGTGSARPCCVAPAPWHLPACRRNPDRVRAAWQYPAPRLPSMRASASVVSRIPAAAIR